ncbi:MAG: hypothetical protein NTW21_16260 [Verrucomicrobia bacterium]|nr:hypothetical protein [Verrucomicrobiota bacterium]
MSTSKSIVSVSPEGCRSLQSKGFALVITLSLMVLLTLLAVGLLSLSTIALRSSRQGGAMALARSNARLALIIALGQLQKTAGPDQRVTAAADFAGDTGGLRLEAGKVPKNDKSINGVVNGLTLLRPGTRYWTGVWNTVTASAPAIQIFTKTPSATGVKWLISGNEVDSATPQPYTPASPVAALGVDGSVSDRSMAVVMVGAASVGTPTATTIGSYVAAPLVNITVPNPHGGNSLGRYAWWIGDEGVKARINIPRTHTESSSYASLIGQRRGWETVAGFKDYPVPSSPTQASLGKVVTLPETQLLIPGAQGVVQSVFHSATADSKAVLADTLNGGTRIDLSAILAGELPKTKKVPSMVNYPVANTNIIPLSVASKMKAPKWDALKEFFDRSKKLQSGSLLVKAATSDSAGSIAPLISEFRILMGVHFVPSGSDFKANPCGKLAVAIANPFSSPLKWDKDLEFEVMNITPPGNAPSRIWNLGGNSVFIPGDPSEGAVFNNTIFRIRPGSLPAGEARAYTVAGASLRALGTGTQRFVVDLSAFGGSGSDFTSCVELDTPGIFSSFPGLDVRESWQTTLMKLEMRLAGSTASSQPLRRLAGFDLDNGYFGQNILEASQPFCAAHTKPVPLMCYSFQISQPGVNYLDLMPAGYEMGQRASTLRTFTDFNLQATRISKAITSYNPPPYFMQSNNGFADLDPGPNGGLTGTAFTKNLLANPLPWGRAPNGSKTTVLFAIPAQITSLAQFQHADLTGDEVAASIGHQPGNAFGNSYATPFVKRNLITQARVDYEIIGSPNMTGVNQYPRTYFDISYLLNAAVWDSYFVSSIGTASTSTTLAGLPENPALMIYGGTAKSALLRDPVACASVLMIDGSFNVNCTDKNAWKAFLGSSKYLDHKADSTASPNASFPRSLEQISPAKDPPTGTATDSFSGYRRLTDPELDALATEIVKQVRLRGPFVSLSHFVNRALADLSKQPALTRSGALQSAIDESGITINFAGNRKGLSGIVATTDRVTLSEKEGAPRADLDGGDLDGQLPNADPYVPDWAVTSTDNNFGAVASIIADRTLLSTQKTEQGYRSTGIPGWLTQADVLQVIGSALTTRSDTFRIRTYGEALSPDGKTVLARAWCESIVQRVPEYLDPANETTARGTELNSLNRTYGRRFNIVSFRWLSPDEI